MKIKTISDRINYLRAVEFKYPEWIPITFEFFPSVWKRHGKKLEDLVRRHPLIFTGLEHEQMLFDERDPLFNLHSYYEDDWGCTWYNVNDGNLGQVVKHPLADWNALDKIKIPDPLEQMNWADLEKKVREDKRKGLPAIGKPESFSQGGFFDRLSFLRGLENLLIDFIDEPPELKTLIEMVLDYNMRYVKRYLEIGVDVMWFHGDIGTQKGMLFSREVFRKFLKPAYKKIFQMCRETGTHVWYSSDGKILEIVDDLVECGVSIHDPQVRANAIDGIAKTYKGRLCALVDIDEQMLPFSRPEEIDHQIKEIVDKIGSRDGGLMIYAIPSEDVPFENIEALCRGWERHCFYGGP